jgi:hypothetical protein
MHKQSATSCHQCTRCGQDLVVTRGAGRTVTYAGITARVPDAMELLRCRGCVAAYPTPAQAEELKVVIAQQAYRDGRGGS